MARAEAGGNPNFLTVEGETFRWTTESALIREGTPDGRGLGTFETGPLQEEVDAYADVGLFPDGAPDVGPFLEPAPIDGLYDDDGTVIWPG